MLTIGFAGYAGSGKDTAAKAICNPAYILEASRDVKAGLLRLNPWIDQDWRLADVVEQWGWDVAKKYPEVRRLLATFGVDAGRDLHGDDIWVSKLRFTLNQWANQGAPLACVTGIRFANEATLCNPLVWVSRPGRGEGEHKSEKLEAIRKLADYVLVNDRTEAEWMEKVRGFFRKVKE